MTKKHISLILAFLVFCGVVVFGQERNQGNGAQNRQTVRENLATLRLLRLTKALDLNEEQAAKIFPTVNRIEKEKLSIQRNMTADIQSLRQIIADPAPKEIELAAKIKSVKDAQHLIRQKDDELETFLEANLTTVQRGKYVIFEIEFYRMLDQSLIRGGMRKDLPSPPIKK
jgi:preprotein translocase subunit YajC